MSYESSDAFESITIQPDQTAPGDGRETMPEGGLPGEVANAIAALFVEKHVNTTPFPSSAPADTGKLSFERVPTAELKLRLEALNKVILETPPNDPSRTGIITLINRIQSTLALRNK